MLNERLNLLGRREGGPAGFLMLALRGDPLARDRQVLMLNGLSFEAPNKGFDSGRRSWGGDGAKHSSNEGVDAPEEKSSDPAPNLKAGSGLASRDLKDTELVE